MEFFFKIVIFLINSIEDVRFLVSLDGETFADSNDVGWEGVKSAEIPKLEVGVHELVVNATDLSGNSAEERFQIIVHPPPIIDIISADIFISSEKLIQGEKVSEEHSGLSKREWNELMEAFDINNNS